MYFGSGANELMLTQWAVLPGWKAVYHFALETIVIDGQPVVWDASPTGILAPGRQRRRESDATSRGPGADRVRRRSTARARRPRAAWIQLGAMSIPATRVPLRPPGSYFALMARRSRRSRMWSPAQRSQSASRLSIDRCR
jgi:hypothetical protein